MFDKKTYEPGITLIGDNCQLAGDICFSDHLIVDGIIKGDVTALSGSKSMITISDKGQVTGNLYAPDVIVIGKVTGDIHSSRHIEIAAKAEIKGNVYYNLIGMVMGSRVDGNIVHVPHPKDMQKENRNQGPEDTRVENAIEGTVAIDTIVNPAPKTDHIPSNIQH